jgi:hypothetical protein
MTALRHISLFLFVNVLSCRQPYLPPVIQVKNNWLVVNGFINAGSVSTNIHLSRSRSLPDSNLWKAGAKLTEFSFTKCFYIFLRNYFIILGHTGQ